jgi:hypothetical protein
MSILADRPNSVAALEHTERQLYGNALGGIGLVVAAILAPKDLGWDMLRLALVAAFFLGVMTVIWSVTDPLDAYLRARLEVSLEDFGAESRALGQSAIDAIGRVLRPTVWLMLTATGLAGLRVLADWPVGAPLEPFKGLFHWGCWIAVLGVPVQLFFNTHRLSEALSVWRSFRLHVGHSRFRLRTIADARARMEALDGPPVVVEGPYRFRAGGMEWSWSDFQKNAIVFGQVGSGKTVAVLNALLDGLLSSADGRPGTEAAAALILDPKGDYHDKIGTLCQRLGRTGNLFVLDPNKPHDSVRWNPFDSTDDALEISERFAGVLQLLGMKNTQDTFWIDTAKTFLRHAVGLLRATEPPDTPPSFAGINELATRPLLLEARLFLLHGRALLAAVGADNYAVTRLLEDIDPADVIQNALHDTAPDAAAIRAYFRRWASKRDSERAAIGDEVREFAATDAPGSAPSLTAGSEALLAAQYLANTWLEMPEKTRGSVQTQLTTMIDPFLTAPYDRIFSGRSTVQLGDVIDRGGIFYVFMPREDRSAMSRMVNTLVKMEYYRQVLLRRGKSRPSLFFCDEFQSFFTSDEGRGDGAFFERSRESFHANVVATQNLSSLLRDVPKEEIVHSFMGNCAIKIFLRNTEGRTNEYASKNIFGEYLGFITTVGRTGGDGGGRQGFRESASTHVNTQMMPVVAPERMTQLAIPDRERGQLYAEALVHLGSRAAVTIDRLLFKVHPLDR